MDRIFILFGFVIALSLDVSSYPASLNDTGQHPFYTRANWGAIPPKHVVPLKTPAPYVVIHHTYLPAACYDNHACTKAMKSMQNYHISIDFGDIGYNFCVGSEGGAYEGQGWTHKGVHAGRANGKSIGICLIGDWRAESPPAVQLEATKYLISEGVRQGFIRQDYKLIGHGQVMSTECPGTALQAEIETWPHYAKSFEPSDD